MYCSKRLLSKSQRTVSADYSKQEIILTEVKVDYKFCTLCLKDKICSFDACCSTVKNGV